MARFFRRRKFCRFTAEGVKEIDYKDLNTLKAYICLLYTSPSPRDRQKSRMPSSA